MDKKEFTYQRWHMRMLGAVFVLPIVYGIQMLINRVLEIEDVSFWYIVLCGTVALWGFTLYYKLTENRKIFIKQGYYWVDNGSVFIERNNRISEIKDVVWINGDTTSAYGVIYVAMLVVKCKTRKYAVYSKTLEGRVHFRRSELYPIYKAILENNPKLKKDKRNPYWYEVEKEC